ncbi:spore germination protein GerPE [Bacillus sp. DJP31]|uniref:spore germination protein GerPE n=1 Tax=Bacillus sp. DJP31 TaxID=3409789 RepID=UPI003BB4F226
MNHRTSVVSTTFINSISFSSVFEIGDTRKINATSQAIAVQREYPLFVENEADFSLYRIFSEIIPSPIIDEVVNTTFIHENPVIKVNSLKITGISNASVVQIGSTHCVKAEARVKHIRQLLNSNRSKKK